MGAPTLTRARTEALAFRAREEGWSAPRLDSALASMRRLDAVQKGKGKPCGKGYIAKGLECRKGGALTPATVQTQGVGDDWKRKAAIAAGLTAGALALGLPVASFIASGSAPGRRASMTAERWARKGATASMMLAATNPATAPFAGPIAMGLMAGGEGVAAGRGARRVVESWRYAPGFAREAARLGALKANRSRERREYIAKLQTAWAESAKEPTSATARRRAAQVAKETANAEKLAREAAIRMRAARRAARISRTGNPWRSSPTPSESFIRRGLINPTPGLAGTLERGGAALTAGFLRELQRTGSGLTRRRVRFYS